VPLKPSKAYTKSKVKLYLFCIATVDWVGLQIGYTKFINMQNYCGIKTKILVYDPKTKQFCISKLRLGSTLLTN